MWKKEGIKIELNKRKMGVRMKKRFEQWGITVLLLSIVMLLYPAGIAADNLETTDETDDNECIDEDTIVDEWSIKPVKESIEYFKEVKKNDFSNADLNTSNYYAHFGTSVTLRKQRQSLLTKVQSGVPN